ncbi:hypothetical protein DFH09DRAFT_1286015 [Mycena vulgaris]|nr:hypothetical protein DFH09DRAFT_1286015 [Mycena vulgaris]
MLQLIQAAPISGAPLCFALGSRNSSEYSRGAYRVATSSNIVYDAQGEVPLTMSYGGRKVNGTTGFVEMQFGGYRFCPKVDLWGIVDVGLDGLMGFGFSETRVSPITAALNQTQPSASHSSLTSSTQPRSKTTSSGSPSCARRTSRAPPTPRSRSTSSTRRTPRLQTRQSCRSSQGNGRWSILVDSLDVDGGDIPLVSNLPNAPDGTFVVVMDTGAPAAYFPPDLLYTVYWQIPGASVFVEGDAMKFIIPGNTSAIVTVVIGSPARPVYRASQHPHRRQRQQVYRLRLQHGAPEARAYPRRRRALRRYIYAQRVLNVRHLPIDFAVISLPLRNFGNTVTKSSTGNATMQLLSQTNPLVAVAAVQNVRMTQLASMPPEFQGPPRGFRAALPGSALPTSTDSSNTAASTRKFTTVVATIADGASSPSGDPSVQKYALIIIGLLSGNLVVVLMPAALGVALYVERGGKCEGSSRAPKHVPVKFKDQEPLHADVCEDRRYPD